MIFIWAPNHHRTDQGGKPEAFRLPFADIAKDALDRELSRRPQAEEIRKF